MKFVKIELFDANTGELIYDTKRSAVGSSAYLRQKINRNIQSFCNYFRDHPGRDVSLQVTIRDEMSHLQNSLLDVF